MAENKINIKENLEIDHWAFLEEIEAPMWTDLTLESNMTAQDNDDAWFHRSHPFHHLSARQLRSAFSHPDVGNDFVNFNLQGVCSPKLPSSVSKSRGKDYTSKPLRNNDLISVSKSHPVNDLGCGISRLDISSSQECEPKMIPENQNEIIDSTSSVLCNDSCVTTVASNSQVAADDRNTRGSLNSRSVCTGGISTSTITTVSHRKDTKVSEFSTKEGFGRTSGLLNALKANLRRSCATRPASRVEICDDRELKGRKSSSGKSSVGSSSIGYDGKVRRSVILTKGDHFEQVKTNVKTKPRGHKSMTRKPNLGVSNPVLEVKKMATGNKRNKDESWGVKGREILAVPIKGRVIANKVDAPLMKIAAGLKHKEYRSSMVRDVGKLAPPAKGQAKSQKLVEASNKSGTCSGSRIEGRGAVAASTCLQAVKSKVSISENVTNRPRFGAPSVKGKVERAHLNGSSCSIKEKTKRLALSRISSSNYNMPVVRTMDQRRPVKLSENKASVASVVSKFLQVKYGRLDDSKLPSEARVYLR